MAFISHPIAYPMRTLNKEPDWSTTYDDLFSQYIDIDNLDFNSNSTGSIKEESGSDEFIGTIFDSVESSALDFKPDNASLHRWSPKEIEHNFWAKTLRCLEENATCLEQDQSISAPDDQHNLNSLPYLDTLNLGEFHTPYMPIHSSPPKESRRRESSLNNNRQPKPAVPLPKSPGIKKKYRQGSKSPRMMSPPRSKVGHKDVWADKAHGKLQTYAMTLPLRPAPLSPPLSANMPRRLQRAGFCSPHEVDSAPFQGRTGYGDEFSQTSKGFPNLVGPHTPIASPLAVPGVEQENLYHGSVNDDSPDLLKGGRSIYYAIPPSAPASARTSWLSPHPADDDFQFSATSNPWPGASNSNIEQSWQQDARTALSGDVSLGESTVAPLTYVHPSFSSSSISAIDAAASSSSSAAANELATAGLMISCDPTLTSGFTLDEADSALSALPTPILYTPSSTSFLYEPQQQQQHEYLDCNTPPPNPQGQQYHQIPLPRSSRHAARSPSIPRPSSRSRSRPRGRKIDKTNPSDRSNQKSKSKSRTRRTSKVPISGGSGGGRGGKGGGFVNLTPSDSAKLLTGVAPSGSSKTKARREKEAADRQRRFSQAAVSALREAGADMERFRDVLI